MSTDISYPFAPVVHKHGRKVKPNTEMGALTVLLIKCKADMYVHVTDMLIFSGNNWPVELTLIYIMFFG